MMENERIGYSKLKEEILKSDNKSDLKKLEALGEYPKTYIDKDMLKA